MFHLLLIVLATAYLTRAVLQTHGPFGVFEFLKAKLPHGGLLSCYVCFAIWAALAFSLLPVWVTQAFAAAGLYVILADAGEKIVEWVGQHHFHVQWGLQNDAKRYAAHVNGNGAAPRSEPVEPGADRAN